MHKMRMKNDKAIKLFVIFYKNFPHKGKPSVFSVFFYVFISTKQKFIYIFYYFLKKFYNYFLYVKKNDIFLSLSLSFISIKIKYDNIEKNIIFPSQKMYLRYFIELSKNL